MEVEDTVVGQMIEGLYGWNEYCVKHGDSYLNIYPTRGHRTITAWEAVNSWRDLKCYACNEVLWNKGVTSKTVALMKKEVTGV